MPVATARQAALPPGHALFHHDKPHETGMRAWADVIGGICFAIAVGKVMTAASAVVFYGIGWGYAIGFESMFLFASLVCATVLPLGIQVCSSAVSTVKSLMLDWPELVVATVILYQYVSAYGLPHGVLAPATMSFSVGAAEEFAFRVILLGWLVTRLDPQRALLVSAAVFGLAHLDTATFVHNPLTALMYITPQFAGGVVLGAMFLRTGNIIGPILAHAYWDLPYFLTLGAGISGGKVEGGAMPSMASFWDFWIWLAFAVYGLWLVRPGIDIAVLPGARRLFGGAIAN